MESSVDGLLSKYSLIIEEAIQRSLIDFGDETIALRKPVEYALMSGGKRIRPLLVFIIADAIGKGLDVSDAAVGIEYVHTSTLVADDLPCMDDDDERRGKPTVHVAFNEATALLASYALIAASYNRLRFNAWKLSESVGLEKAWTAYHLVLENVAFNTGAVGVLGGQFSDLFAENYLSNDVEKTIHQKTGSLFEMAFVMGWLFGGGDAVYLDTVKTMAFHFGLVFQIGDDLLDLKQDGDKEEAGLNYVSIFGEDHARETLQYNAAKCRECIKSLPIEESELFTILDYILGRV